ncbi:porin family protein [Sphingomonas sp. So64.6b]|uniref:outer membrane protein n=1 Tax=Sphingomonas sp. So64.6b TaxID=2997354 RepID=UPI001601B118|nr:outer membrane beta-barrel protein [Sphingomonas sp. So64.6b]QNA84810.1 porin family protein [Sphingomonas sp. So64.6b]
MRSLYMLTLAAGTAALALAGPAFAQDTEKAPFDGVYVGGTIGFDAQPNDGNETILFDRNLDGNFGDTVTTGTGANAFSRGFCGGAATSTANIACRNDKDNISYSARIGFDKQFGNIVAGVVGEFGKSQIRDSVSAFSTTPASYTMTREIDYDANLRLRLGYAANTTLFYATGGPAYAKLDHSFTTSNGLNSFTGSGDDDAWGFVAGGGIEQKLGRNFSIGLEYLYNQYKDDDYIVRAGAGTAPATNPFILPPNTTGTDFARSDDQFRWHSVRATAQFRF